MESADVHDGDRTDPGVVLRRQRLELGITQETLAERSGVAKRTIQDLERGIAIPRRDTMRRLIDALRPSPEARALLEAVRPAARPRVANLRVSEPRVHGLVGGAVDQPQSSNLPVPPTRLIGREGEAAALHRLLLRDDVTLVTLTGPAGTGKTRLGLRVAADLADRFTDGVYFVPLAPISDASLVPATIAQVLEIRDIGGRPILESLKAYLRSRRLLLLLDNFEQIVAAAPVVGELLASSPGLKILATSRAPLKLRGEHERPIPPLALPDPLHPVSVEAVSQSAAGALFVERAVAIKPDFAVAPKSAQEIAEICHRLDGLPLAIELAAARVRLLTPQAILARLERRLSLLTGGPSDLPVRQQTLRGAIAWSHDLLAPSEQRLFRRLAVFAGGCTLEAAEAVDGESPDTLDELASLVEKSLLRPEAGPTGDVRLTMLETIREYATEQLEMSGEQTILRDRHLAHFLAFAEASRAELQGPNQASAFDRLEREHDNLRAALEWSATEASSSVLHGEPERGGTSAARRVEDGTRLAAALGFFWVLRGRGRENLSRVLALAANTPAGTHARARAVTSAAHVQGHMLGNYATALPFAEEGLHTWRALGNAQGTAVALVRLGQIAFETGDYPGAVTRFTEARDIFRGLGGECGPEVPTDLWLAEVAQAQGDLNRAQHLYDAVLKQARTSGDGHAVAHALREIARLRRTQADSIQALSLLRESAALYIPLKDIRCACILLEDLAGVLCELSQPADAARLFGAAEALRTLSGRPLTRAQRATHSRDLETVRRQLAPNAFAAAWAAGHAMTLEQAVAFAANGGAPPIES